MLLTIHDANLQKVAFIDNDKQGTLNYYNDVWTRNLETGSSTFEFSVFKKAIQSDTALHKTYNALNEKAFISFKYHGKSYVFSVMTVEENEDTIKCYCENLNLELINEYANPYKSDKPKSFVEYCNAMDLLNFTHLTVGINEISDKKLTLEWEGQDTKLARLLSLATKFDAEIDFDTQLNADSTIKSFKVNVYHENDDTHQGVGRVRNDVQLVYGKNLKSITRKIDKTGIYTMVVPTGKRTVKNGKGEEVEEIVTIGSLKPAYSENNKDGVREFYQSGNALYAPIAAQMYPSTFTTGTQADQWIRKDLEVDSDNPTVIRAAGIRNLKKNAYPALSYIVDGFLDVEIGDTIKIFDDAFVPALLVLARVSEQKISFSNPANNKTVFANFKELERNLSAGIQAAFERLFEASKPYLIKLSTDNGVIFKNQAGQTIINPTLYKGGKVISNDVTWRWSLDGNVTTGMTYTVKGSDVTNTVTLTVAAYIGNNEVAVDEITLVNVTDGKNGVKGSDGAQGLPGKPGADGRTPYFHRAWANSANGRDGFSTSDSTNKRYLGTLTDFTEADSQDPSQYKWTALFDNVIGGNRNYFKNGRTQRINTGGTGTYDMRTYIVDDFWKNPDRLKPNYVRISFEISLSPALSKDTQVAVHFSATPWYNSRLTLKAGITTPQKFEFVIDLSKANEIYKTDNVFVRFGTNYGFPANLTVTLDNAMLSIGTNFLGYVKAVEDVEDNINSKADQSLTQEQLNALAEKSQIHDAELKAKASMEAFSDLEKAYNSFVKANDASKAKAEADLAEAGRRIELLVTQFGSLKELKTFIDTYMSSSNEGLIIGKNDASSTIKVSSDRISMFSAGKEVMYISQGVIHIDNGIFTASVQIGRFRTEQYHLNPDVNVIRYVGGR
ncbi:TPA: phage tail spike protein [Streptococcus pyogenes]|uniref:phage tail spike protein n=1 Tax=Streptococcus sp. HMSC034F03 TaxID=1739287 RepID=UPI0008A87010|nr:phage tail spike protein [Streptococcus sp. HMSC034F03]OHR61001.1 hypothetical protein HMPREF2783_10140 [Streptococcus sp. HMSC034F03]HER9558042.1 phage tail protein [Streptococcus pyogenes]